MYRTCLFCNADLGENQVLPTFPVGRRLAFDEERGRLWVICTCCGRWNLTVLEERWEALEECERRFRQTHLRAFTDNVGLAQLPEGLELVRIGHALRPEIAAWRYGRLLQSGVPRRLADAGARLAGNALDVLLNSVVGVRPGYDAITWLRIRRQRNRIVDVAATHPGDAVLIRGRHLEGAELMRPDRREPWRLSVRHERGTTVLTGSTALRTAGKLLAAINGFGATNEDVRYAMRKLDDAGNPDSFFSYVAELALRTSWGRVPDAPRDAAAVTTASTDAERLALYLTNRSFWGRGALGSEPRTALPRLPLVDRLALEMAANEDAERRALDGELAQLEAAWRDAEEIAAIADGLLSERASMPSTATWMRRLRRGYRFCGPVVLICPGVVASTRRA